MLIYVGIGWKKVSNGDNPDWFELFINNIEIEIKVFNGRESTGTM